MGKEPVPELLELYKAFKICLECKKRVEVSTCKGIVLFTPITNHPDQAMITILEEN